MAIICSLLKTRATLLTLVASGIILVQSESPATWSNECGKVFRLNGTDEVNFNQLEFEEETICKWELIGDTECAVEVSCTFTLPSNSDERCGDTHLLITDGYATIGKYCGRKTTRFVRSNEGLRDLFLELHSGPTPDKIGGLSCLAKCVDGPDFVISDNQRRLPEKWKVNTDSTCVCGLQNEDSRIVGGEDAKFNEFPWMAAIVHYDTREPFCGGALINDRYILTSAHCFVKPDPDETFKADDIDVLLHAHVLDKTEQNENGTSIQSSGDDLAAKTDADEKTLRFAVKEIVTHPLFSQNFDYDFALLRLKKHVKLSDEDAPTPVCLPPVTVLDPFEMEGKTMVVSGWGLIDEKAKESTRILQKLEVPYITSEKCNEYYPNHITDRMVCFGYEIGEKDSCIGDSGGPLVYQQPSKQWWQLGIVSFGSGCARANHPGIYAKVSEVIQWIHYHTAHHGAKWCKDKWAN